MDRMKRVLAGLLCVAMLFTMEDFSLLASAQEVTESSQTEDESGTLGEETQTADQTAVRTQEDTQTEETDAPLINYGVLDASYIEAPDIQNILIGITQNEATVEDPVLHMRKEGETEDILVKESKMQDDGILFTIEHQNAADKGIYGVTSIDFTYQGKAYTIDFAEIGMEMKYGVDEIVENEPDAYVVEEETEEDATGASDEECASQIVSFDENGNTTSENNLAEAIEHARENNAEAQSEDATGASNVVVVLDPGHGGTSGGPSGGGDSGACKNGLMEKDLNLKIALACRDELNTYEGVTVYMTRETDVYVGLAERTAYASSKGADIFVSIHNNSAPTSASGSIVFYPNSNYNSAIGAEGKSLADKILAQLVALGLKNNGVQIRNSERGDTYEDGSLCDYYAVIRAAKRYGFPGIIVEHAFISNASDTVNFLGNDNQLARLGVADATGIAQYLGLQKKSAGLVTPTLKKVKMLNSNSLQLTWTGVSYANHYQIYRSTSKDGKYTKIGQIEAYVCTYVDTTAKPGQTYYYKVRGRKTNGDSYIYSKCSNKVKASTVEKPVVSSVVSKSPTSLKITWGKVAGASGYKIVRKKSGGSYTTVAKVTSGTTVSYLDEMVEAGTLYYYKVQAMNNNNGVTGYSGYASSMHGRTIEKPVLKSVMKLTDTRVSLSWSKVAGVSGYVLQRSTSKNGTYNTVAKMTSADVVKFTDDTVQKDKQYYYKIKAYVVKNGKTGVSGYTAPVAVNNETISIDAVKSIDGALEVTWNEHSSVKGYVVYRSTSKDTGYSKVRSVSSSSTIYKDGSVEAGKTYYYKVRVYTKSGDTTSYGMCSAAVSGSAVEATTITELKATSSTKLKLSWQKVSGASGYLIYRSTSKSGTYSKIATISSGSTVTYTDKVTAGKTYYYKVRVTKKINKLTGYSSFSEKKAGAAPKSTSITYVKSANSTKLTLVWKQISGASGYVIYRSTTKSGGYSKIKTITSGGTTTYTDSGLSAGKTYYYKIKTTNTISGKTGYSSSSSAKSGAPLKTTSIKSITASKSKALTITWSKISNATGYRIYRSTSKSGTYTKVGSVSSGSTLTYTDTGLSTYKTYYYKVRAVKTSSGVTGYGSYSEVKSGITGYSIMGSSTVSVAQMVAFYNKSGKIYPADTYKDRGASTLTKFCQIVYNEAKAEGVCAEVVWAQICLETGYLSFPGDVRPDQCNFGGLGATGNGVTGEVFENVTIGVRAQVQHLKAYGSTEGLKQTCVDNRFQYVTRGVAPIVEWLGIQENPVGAGWATAKDYGYTLVAIINRIKAC